MGLNNGPYVDFKEEDVHGVLKEEYGFTDHEITLIAENTITNRYKSSGSSLRRGFREPETINLFFNLDKKVFLRPHLTKWNNKIPKHLKKDAKDLFFYLINSKEFTDLGISNYGNYNFASTSQEFWNDRVLMVDQDSLGSLQKEFFKRIKQIKKERASSKKDDEVKDKKVRRERIRDRKEGRLWHEVAPELKLPNREDGFYLREKDVINMVQKGIKRKPESARILRTYEKNGKFMAEIELFDQKRKKVLLENMVLSKITPSSVRNNGKILKEYAELFFPSSALKDYEFIFEEYSNGKTLKKKSKKKSKKAKKKKFHRNDSKKYYTVESVDYALSLWKDHGRAGTLALEERVKSE